MSTRIKQIAAAGMQDEVSSLCVAQRKVTLIIPMQVSTAWLDMPAVCVRVQFPSDCLTFHNVNQVPKETRQSHEIKSAEMSIPDPPSKKKEVEVKGQCSI